MPSPVEEFFRQHLNLSADITSDSVNNTCVTVYADSVAVSRINGKIDKEELEELSALWLKKFYIAEGGIYHGVQSGIYAPEITDLSEGIQAFYPFFSEFSLQKTGGFIYTGGEEYSTVIQYLAKMREWSNIMRGEYYVKDIPFVKPNPLCRVQISLESTLLQDVSKSVSPLYPAFVLEHLIRWLGYRDEEQDDEYEFALYSLYKLISWGEGYVYATNAKYNRLIASKSAGTVIVPAISANEFCWMRDFVIRTKEILTNDVTLNREHRIGR